MDLRDATLMMLTESAGHPELERLARTITSSRRPPAPGSPGDPLTAPSWPS